MPEDQNPETVFFERLREATDAAGTGASTRLKSKTYTALIEEMQASGPLLDVGATEDTDALCVFEKLMAIAPLPEGAACFNACSVCHARVMGERIENAPIYWKHCPYVGFQNR